MTDLRYRAFVSFSHEADERVAAALQSSLTRFAKPWYRLRSMRIFRDATSLSANPALWNAIEVALAQCEYLVLLASSGSAKSRWVQQELRWWLANRPADRLILCLTEGVILWDDRLGDFDWQKTTAISSALKGVFPAEPLYADFRAARASGRLSDTDTDYRAALLDVAAPLMGRPKDELDGEDIRLHRAAQRTAWAVAVVIVTLGAIAGVALGIAQQRQRTAESRALASAAATPLEDRSLALLLGIESHRIADTVESRRSILSALQRLPNAAAFFWGHTRAVTKAVFSPDGQSILSAGWDDRLILWNAATHQPVGAPIPVSKGLVGVAFDPDGARFATAAHGEIVVWDAKARRPLGEPFKVPGEDFEHVAFSTTGMLLAATTAAYGGHPSQVYLWDIAGHRLIDAPLSGSNVAFGPGDTLLAVARYNDLILYDLRTHREVKRPFEGTSGNIASIAFNDDGTLVTAGAEDKTISLWDVRSHRSLGKAAAPDIVDTLRFGRDGESLYSGSLGGVIVKWQVPDLTAFPTTIASGGAAISSIFLAPDGRARALALEKERVVLLDIDDAPPLGRRFSAPGSGGSNIAFSPDGRDLATGAEFGGVSIWEVASGELSGAPLSGHERQVSSLAYAPDGTVLVSGSMDGGILFWNMATRSALGPPVRTDRSPVWSLACSPDGKSVAAGGDAQLADWDLATRLQRAPAITLHDRVWSLAFSSRGDLMAAAGNSLQTTLWKTRPRAALVKTLGTPEAGDEFELIRSGVGFDPGGKLMAASSPGYSVTVWSIDTGLPIPPVLYGHTQAVTSVAFSGDGKVLASAGADGDIRLWDVPTHELLGTLGPRQKAINDIEFQPGHSLLASVSDDDAITFWTVGVEDWISAACRVANRNLTQKEWRTYLGSAPYRKSCPDPE